MVLIFAETEMTGSGRHPTYHQTCRRSPLKPCRTKGEADERPARPDNHKEPVVVWIDCRPSDAGSVHIPRMLHRGRGQSHRTRVSGREDVYPRNERSWNRDVCKRAKGRVGYRPMAQAVRPYQLPAASRNANVEYCFWIAEI